MIFWTKFVQNGYFWSKTEKSGHRYQIQHSRINLDAKFFGEICPEWVEKVLLIVKNSSFPKFFTYHGIHSLKKQEKLFKKLVLQFHALKITFEDSTTV